MLKKLGPHAILTLSKLFTLCLRNGDWFWNDSNIIFLKKAGKSSYAKAGSYRPISISPYIGKLFERILATRLENFLQKIGLTDDNQEGFCKGRNTTRYLHRLTAGIKGDIQKKLTVLCLFIDFEKAFDSVWKKGLIVKLWKVGVHGCFLKTLDSFLFGRTVSLLLNGFVGPIRSCLDYGLPQGSVLSPVLFRFYILDIEAMCDANHHVVVFKFADDGTIKVTGTDLEECLLHLETVLQSLSLWTSRWKMVINCNPDKTEVICFNTYEPLNVPSEFTIGRSCIKLTDQTKVLGVILDSKLKYKGHSSYVFNKLMYKWTCISRYSNRNWGMSQAVLIRISKTVLFSSLFYGSIVWTNNTTLGEINKLWYRIAKSAVGAVFNVNASILDVITGVPPLQVLARVIATKHYLKVLSGNQDIHKEFIATQLVEENRIVQIHLKDVRKFLKWRLTSWEKEPDLLLEKLTARRDSLSEVPVKYFKYTKKMMEKFTEALWQETIETELMIQGWSQFPQVSCEPLPIPRNTSREKEVLVMSLLYENNIMNSFLFKVDKVRWKSPLCVCGTGDQDAHHLLAECSLVIDSLKKKLAYLLQINNQDKSHITTNGVTALLNCSRDPEFISSCLEVIDSEGLQLRTKVTLAKKKG